MLRAREQSMALSRGGNIAARSLAEAAVGLDPQYAAAHALLAFTHLNDLRQRLHKLVIFRSIRCGWASSSLGGRCRWTRRSLRLTLHWVRLSRWKRDLEGALTETRRGLELSPNSVNLLLLLTSVKIYFLGDPTGALQTIDQCMRLDPHYPDIALQFLADARFSLREDTQAIVAIEQRLARNSQSETAYALLASCYGHLGRSEEARRAWEQVLRINPNFSIERVTRPTLPKPAGF